MKFIVVQTVKIPGINRPVFSIALRDSLVDFFQKSRDEKLVADKPLMAKAYAEMFRRTQETVEATNSGEKIIAVVIGEDHTSFHDARLYSPEQHELTERQGLLVLCKNKEVIVSSMTAWRSKEQIQHLVDILRLAEAITYGL